MQDPRAPENPEQEIPSGIQQNALHMYAQERANRVRELKRRRREILLAAAILVLLLVLIWVQLELFGSGSAIFLALFNFNFVLLLVVLFLVLRNGLKLILERRRRVLGARLRTRLVLAFMTLTIIPCALMFVVTAQFVKLSVDFWFKDQVETSFESAMDLGRSMYENAGNSLRLSAESMLDEVQERRFAWGGQNMETFLARKKKEHQLALAGLLDSSRNKRIWQADPAAEESWESVRDALDWQAVRDKGFQFMLGKGTRSDVVYGVLAVDAGKRGYLVSAKDLGAFFKTRMDRIASGAGEYKQLRNLKYPLKWSLYVTLGVLTGLIFLGALWFAFRVAKELTAPVMALVAATERVARGDLSVRLNDKGTDEYGILIQSFNRMAEDLGQSRQELTDANELLALQNARLDGHRRYVETVLDNITAGVLSFDAQGLVTTVNKAARQLLQLPTEELVGRHVSEIVPERHLPLTEEIRRQLENQPDFRLNRQISLEVGGEERRLMVNSVGLIGPDGHLRGSVAVLEDITELERMQRMAAWREVARRIAHEIKNPLTPIKLCAQRLQRKFGDQVLDPAFAESTRLIVHEVEELLKMVQEFSSFAKLPELSLKPGFIGPMLEKLMEMFKNSHSRINWQLAMPTELPTVYMDESALHRAFLNILSNCAEALEHAPNPQVRVKAEYDAKMELLRVEVADNGPGLSEEERSRIFEPYFSRKKGGTGLGLTIVKSIISDHHGYVRAGRNNLGGASITVELPREL